MFSACDWLAALTAHIPNAGEHLVRSYGWYSNVSRGTRRKAQGEERTPIEEFNDVSAWAPLLIACIEQPEVIEKILTHLGVWPAHLHSPPAGVPVAISPATGLLAA